MTATETISENLNLKPKWWIKFNPSTGGILRISPKTIAYPNEDVPYKVETSNSSICNELLRGTLSLKQCGMIYDPSREEWFIEKKTDNLILKNLSGDLFQIKKTNPINSDVILSIYKEQSLLEVTLNIKNVRASMNLFDIQTVSRSEDTLLNLYVTRLNDPDHLISIIEIDPLLLFAGDNKLFIDLCEIKKYADWNQISIFTRPIFKSYSIEFHDTRIETDYIKHKNNIFQIVENSVDSNSHIYISGSGKNLKIVSNNIKHNYMFNNKKELNFLVCENTIDEIVGGFSVAVKDVLGKKNIDIQLPFDMPANPIILYKNRYLSINYTGETI